MNKLSIQFESPIDHSKIQVPLVYPDEEKTSGRIYSDKFFENLLNDKRDKT